MTQNLLRQVEIIRTFGHDQSAVIAPWQASYVQYWDGLIGLGDSECSYPLISAHLLEDMVGLVRHYPMHMRGNSHLSFPTLRDPRLAVLLNPASGLLYFNRFLLGMSKSLTNVYTSGHGFRSGLALALGMATRLERYVVLGLVGAHLHFVREGIHVASYDERSHGELTPHEIFFLNWGVRPDTYPVGVDFGWVEDLSKEPDHWPGHSDADFLESFLMGVMTVLLGVYGPAIGRKHRRALIKLILFMMTHTVPVQCWDTVFKYSQRDSPDYRVQVPWIPNVAVLARQFTKNVLNNFDVGWLLTKDYGATTSSYYRSAINEASVREARTDTPTFKFWEGLHYPRPGSFPTQFTMSSVPRLTKRATPITDIIGFGERGTVIPLFVPFGRNEQRIRPVFWLETPGWWPDEDIEEGPDWYNYE